MRNESRIRLMVLMLLLLPGPALFIESIADPVSEPESGTQGTATQDQAESSDAARNKKPVEDGSEESPADPFIPSETISSDSAISFPVDI